MGNASTLILIAVAIAAFFVIRAYLRMRAEQRLRDNPPARDWIEVRLPRGTADANEKMKSLYRKVAPMLATDPRSRAAGAGVMDVVYLFDVPYGQQQPVMRFFLACPPDAMNTLKRLIKQTFGGMVEVIPAKDPMAEMREALAPPPEEIEG